MQITMGTSPTETLSVAGNIFVGQVLRSFTLDHLMSLLWVLNINNSINYINMCPACFSFIQTEAPLLIRPYLLNMTKSEIHAVMVGGFATIAGSVMGAFISFGVR